MIPFFHYKNVETNIFVHIFLVTVYLYFYGLKYHEIVGDFWVKEYTHL